MQALKDLWDRSPRWAIYAAGLALAVVAAAALAGSEDAVSIWIGFVKLCGATVALAFFLMALRLLNSVSALSFDEAGAKAKETPLGVLGLMLYFGLRVLALAWFLGSVLRW